MDLTVFDSTWDVYNDYNPPGQMREILSSIIFQRNYNKCSGNEGFDKYYVGLN